MAIIDIHALFFATFCARIKDMIMGEVILPCFFISLPVIVIARLVGPFSEKL